MNLVKANRVISKLYARGLRRICWNTLKILLNRKGNENKQMKTNKILLKLMNRRSHRTQASLLLQNMKLTAAVNSMSLQKQNLKRSNQGNRKKETRGSHRVEEQTWHPKQNSNTNPRAWDRLWLMGAKIKDILKHKRMLSTPRSWIRNQRLLS